ncbi:MAG: hypothetical protein KKD38_02685, partial [Candidatus Delongbacteria bacterium]|nr:hypothetical protein [Candidatus Delongbacteria bacterium]
SFTRAWMSNYHRYNASGMQDIKVNEPDAEIYINGDFRNSAKLKEKRAVDDYIITIKKYGYITEEFEVPVKENETTYVSVDICEKLSPFEKENYFSNHSKPKLYTWNDFYQRPNKLSEIPSLNMKKVGTFCLLYGSILTAAISLPAETAAPIGLIGGIGCIANGSFWLAEKKWERGNSIFSLYTNSKENKRINKQREDQAKDFAQEKADSYNKDVETKEEEKRKNEETEIYKRNLQKKKEYDNLVNKTISNKRSVKYKIGNGTYIDITDRIDLDNNQIYK